MRFTPFLYLSGGGSVVHYITGAEMPRVTGQMNLYDFMDE